MSKGSHCSMWVHRTHLLPELAAIPEALDDDIEEAVVLAGCVGQARPCQGQLLLPLPLLLLLLHVLLLRPLWRRCVLWLLLLLLLLLLPPSRVAGLHVEQVVLLLRVSQARLHSMLTPACRLLACAPGSCDARGTALLL
jgi:hypothetical protein